MSTGMIAVIATIVGTLVLCVVVVWLVIANTKKQAYQGIIARKNEEGQEGVKDGSYIVYTLVVKTEEGTEKSVVVGKEIWDQFKVGDRIVKKLVNLVPLGYRLKIC